VNIGKRQEGRLSPKSVIHCEAKAEKIIEGVSKALLFKGKTRFSSPYDRRGKTSELIYNQLLSFHYGSFSKIKKFHLL